MLHNAGDKSTTTQAQTRHRTSHNTGHPRRRAYHHHYRLTVSPPETRSQLVASRVAEGSPKDNLALLPGHSGISVNEKADRLARGGSSATGRIVLSASDIRRIVNDRQRETEAQEALHRGSRGGGKSRGWLTRPSTGMGRQVASSGRRGKTCLPAGLRHHLSQDTGGRAISGRRRGRIGPYLRVPHRL